MSTLIDEIIHRMCEINPHLSSDSSVARALKVDRSNIYQWRKKNSVAHSPIALWADQENISLDWLFRGLGEAKFHIGINNKLPIKPDDYVTITNGLVGDKLLELKFRKEWFEKKNIKTKNVISFRVNEDSMRPTVDKGDTLLVDIYIYSKEAGNKLEIKSGLSVEECLTVDGLYLLRVDGKQKIRRLQLDTKGGAYILSDNPSYQKLHMTKEEINEMVMGKVIWIAKDIG